MPSLQFKGKVFVQNHHLAVVVYTKEVNKVVEHLSSVGWFGDDEIVRL